jgi:hypothetical protein
MEEMKEAFSTLNVDPRVVGHQAMANARLYEILAQPGEGVAAFVDVGHRKTVVSLAGPRGFIGSRVVLHGGYDLTRALSEQLSLSMAEAESQKHAAHLYPAGDGVAVGRLQETANCLLDNLQPLLRDLHQAFKALGDPDEVYLFGGGAKLQGLDGFLGNGLGLPVRLLFPSMLKVNYPQELDSLQFVSAIAQAYNSQKGGDASRINFRQAAFAYEGDFKFMRGRIIYLAVNLLVLAGLLAAPQWMKYQSFVEQEDLLRTQLSQLSSTLLGEELDDWEEILARLEEMPPAEVWTVFPDLTAHEVFWEVMDIVARIEGQPTGEMAGPGAPAAADGAAPGPDGVPAPAGDAAAAAQPAAVGPDGLPLPESAAPAVPVAVVHHLEMNMIRIEGATRTGVGDGMVEFTGNASSVATMELFLSTVGKHACFHNIERTKQEMLKATPGKEGWWRFTVEFTISCPKKSAGDLKKDRGGPEGSKKDGEPGAPGAGTSAPGAVPGKEEAGDGAERGAVPAALPVPGQPEARRDAGEGRGAVPDRGTSPADAIPKPDRQPVSPAPAGDRPGGAASRPGGEVLPRGDDILSPPPRGALPGGEAAAGAAAAPLPRPSLVRPGIGGGPRPGMRDLVTPQRVPSSPIHRVNPPSYEGE